MRKQLVTDLQHLVKATGAIEISEPEGTLTLSDRRLFNHLLAHAYKGLARGITKHLCRASAIRAFAAEARRGAEDRDNRRIKESISKLQRVLVQFNYLNSDQHRIWLSSPLLSTCELNETTGELEYEFTGKLAALLIEPALYSYISLKIIYQFESKYGLILYEILKRYADRDAAEPYWTVKTLELRDLLGCRDKLKDWANFRLRALNPALDEINSLASFSVEMDEVRQGRGKGGGQVVGVVFRVTKKPAENAARAAVELDKPKVQRRGERKIADQEKALRWLAMSDIGTRSRWERRAADLGVTLPPAATAVENLSLWVPAIAEQICKDERI